MCPLVQECVVNEIFLQECVANENFTDLCPVFSSGPNSGSSADYIYEVLGITLSFGVELRDTGEFGFLLPEEQIIPTAEENFEAMKVFAQAAIDEFNRSK